MSDEITGRAAFRVPSRGMDPATKRLALIAAGLGGALLAVMGAWSTLSGRPGEVPVIAAPAGPMRVKPANPGGLKISNNSLLAGGMNDADGDTLAPAPEVPDPQALKPPAPAAPSAAPLAAPVPVTSVAPATPPAPVAAPALPAVAPAHPPVEKHAEGAAKPANRGGAQVQLAALETRAQAEAQWSALARREPALAGRNPSFSEVQVNGRSWWRVRTGGFADEVRARAFCDKLRGGGVACSVARF